MGTDAYSGVRASLRPRALAVALLGICALLAVSLCLAEGSAAGAARSRGVVATLSNLRTLSRWAYPQATAGVREPPSTGARGVDHLRFLNGDGQAQVYLALRSYAAGPVTWIRVPIPGRPNGIDGW